MTVPIIIAEFAIIAYVGLLIAGEQTLLRALLLGVVIFFAALLYDVMNNDPYETSMEQGLGFNSDPVDRSMAIIYPWFLVAIVACIVACILAFAFFCVVAYGCYKLFVFAF